MTIPVDDFTAEARSFLDAHAERHVEEEFEWGRGSDSVGILEEKSAEEETAEVAAAKAWKATEYDAGFGWLTGPEEYGGRALPGAHDRAYRDLLSGYTIPSQMVFAISAGNSPPDPPCSAKIAIATRGCSTGQNPTNHPWVWPGT